MANRHLARSVVLQSLFEWDFRDQKASVLSDAIVRDAAEFAPGNADLTFMEELGQGV